jgi:hypothetical protein
MHRLAQELYIDDIKSIELFHQYEKEFIVPLLIAAKPFQVNRNDIIYSEGDVMNEIIFIKSGQVDITILSGHKHYLIGSISKGNYLGDSEYYKNVCSIATYRAALHCELLSVSHSVFDIANSKHLNAGVRFKNEIQQRFNNLEKIIKLCKQEIMEKLHDYETSPSKSNRASTSFRSTPLSPMSSSQSLRRSKFYISNDTSSLSSPSQRSNEARRSSRSRLELIHCSNVVINGEIKDISEANLVCINVNDNTYKNNIGDHDYDYGSNNNNGGSSSSSSSSSSSNSSIQSVRVLICDKNDNNKEHVLYMNNSIIIPEKYLLYPNGYYKIIWDTFIASLIIYCVFVVPIELAFSHDAFEGSPTVNLGMFNDICYHMNMMYIIVI